MAQKRMFDKDVIGIDSFLDLPMEAKALYFLLGMEADDEGFINPKKVVRLYGGNEDSIKILILKGFLIPFKSGVVVITDWKRNNYLDKTRVKETIYQDEKAQIEYDAMTQKYQCLTDVKQMLKQNRIEEYSIEENSIDNKEDTFKLTKNFNNNQQCEVIAVNTNTRCKRKSSYNINGINYCSQHAREVIPNIEANSKRFTKPSIEEIKKYCEERNNGINAEAFYDFYESKDWYVGKNKMKDWEACIRTWEKRNRVLKNEPKWLNEEQQQEIATIDEQKEMEELLKDYGR